MEQIRSEIAATHDRPPSSQMERRRSWLMHAHQHLIEGQYALDNAGRSSAEEGISER
jgi:hypothetical protein